MKTIYHLYSLTDYDDERENDSHGYYSSMDNVNKSVDILNSIVGRYGFQLKRGTDYEISEISVDNFKNLH